MLAPFSLANGFCLENTIVDVRHAQSRRHCRVSSEAFRDGLLVIVLQEKSA